MVLYSISQAPPPGEVVSPIPLCLQCNAPCDLGTTELTTPLVREHGLATGHCLACTLDEWETLTAYGDYVRLESYTLSLTFSLLTDSRETYE